MEKLWGKKIECYFHHRFQTEVIVHFFCCKNVQFNIYFHNLLLIKLLFFLFSPTSKSQYRKKIGRKINHLGTQILVKFNICLYKKAVFQTQNPKETLLSLVCYSTSNLYALSLYSLQLLLDVSQFLLLPLDIGLDHSCPLLQLFLKMLHGINLS